MEQWRIRSNVHSQEDSFLQQLINTRLSKSRDNQRSMLGAERLINTALKTDYSNPHVLFKSKRGSQLNMESENTVGLIPRQNEEENGKIARISLFDSRTWEIAALRLGKNVTEYKK